MPEDESKGTGPEPGTSAPTATATPSRAEAKPEAKPKPKRGRPRGSKKPTTRRDAGAELDNENDPLAGDLHADLRANDTTGAVDFYADADAEHHA